MAAVKRGVALVTGCAQGLGRVIATRLAADGFDLALLDLPAKRDPVEELASELEKTHKGTRTCAALGDVTSEEQVQDSIKRVVEKLGGADVLVTSVGIGRVHLICDLPEKEWDEVISVNLKSAFLCYKHVGKQMVKQARGGRIIDINSISSKRGLPLASAYSASKFAVRGLTQSAAAEFGPYGITVNAVASGPIDTDLVRTVQSKLKDLAESAPGAPWERIVHTLSGATASLGVRVEAGDVAGMVSYLASPEGRYVTGQTINVDGGIQYD